MEDESEEAVRRFESTVLVVMRVPTLSCSVDDLVEPDGRNEKQPERPRDQRRARRQAEPPTKAKSGQDGDDRHREGEQRVAEGVLEVTGKAVLLDYAKDDGVVGVLPADHAEGEKRSQEEHAAKSRFWCCWAEAHGPDGLCSGLECQVGVHGSPP